MKIEKTLPEIDIEKFKLFFEERTGEELRLTTLSKFDDKVEITSPGKLMPSVDFNQMEAGQSEIRNKLIAATFKKLGIIEQWGNGLKIIFDDLKNYPEIELNWSEPGIAFRVTFSKKSYTPEMSEKTRAKMSEKMSENILWLIKDNPEISAKELAYIVNRSSRTIERAIAKLKKEGRIKRIGPDKGGHWEVMKCTEEK